MRARVVAWLGTLDPVLEIDVEGATEALLDVLEGRITAGRLAVYLSHIMRNVVRYGECRGKYTLYRFRGEWRGCALRTGLIPIPGLYDMAQSHVRALLSAPSFAPSTPSTAFAPHRSPVARLEARCNASGIVGTAIAKMVKSMRATATSDATTARDFARGMDGGEYIGFRNGVYDLSGDRFIPSEQVHHSVLVSMSTGYDYVAPDACPRETIDEIVGFYRTLFSDPNDPNDANLAAAWRFSGSLLTAGRKCAVAFVGAGCSGKTTFTSLMHRTLGGYCQGMFVARFKRSAHCDNEKVRMAVYAEVGRMDVVRFESEGKALSFRATPVMHATADLSPSLARAVDAGSARAVHFGSKFVHEGVDPARRLYACDPTLVAREVFDTWAPAHFHLMLAARSAT